MHFPGERRRGVRFVSMRPERGYLVKTTPTSAFSPSRMVLRMGAFGG
jgi:hypothetical protein